MTRLVDTLGYEPKELDFGTSGLRGLVADMTDLECYINTVGFIDFLKQYNSLTEGEVVLLAGDLRDSTPRVLQAVQQAVLDSGMTIEYCGRIPTPALAYYALQRKLPCIMVTGSHIPADRNGIKFYKREGEVLKSDEVEIKAAVAAVREKVYALEPGDVPFDNAGMLLAPSQLPDMNEEAGNLYVERYTAIFGENAFAGKEIVFYQHSAVGRDMLADLLWRLGANVIPVGRSDVFVPIDTENVEPEYQEYFRTLAAEHPNAFAVVSTDGDSDRPFVVDEHGVFNRGDVLGAVVAEWLKADFAAYPVSSSDAVDAYLEKEGVPYEHTKIGSPYVIVAMQEAASAGKNRVVGWEVNGGFLLGGDVEVNGNTLKALPTRDAILPIIVSLLAAIERGYTVSQLFGRLPARFTQAGLIDNFPTEISKQIISRFSADTAETRAALAQYFTAEKGFGEITKIDSLDGVRIFFSNNDVAHMRPSGNAPQLRMYSVADSQERADEIVGLAIAESGGIFRSLQSALGR